jgi:hypothetical protein
LSQINNRIVTTFTSSAGNAIAVMNQMSGGMTNLGRAAYQSGQMSERMNAQWRAFGTTIRYAVAGSVIFGATRLLTVLRDTQRQYALVGAISGGAYSSQVAGAKAADSALAQLYQNAQTGSMDAITPVNDFNDALVNLFSTIEIHGPDKGEKAVQLTTAISQGAQLATVPVDDLTRSITGMNQAFGRTQNMKNIQQGIRGFTELVYRAPGGVAYGPQFIQQLAPLGAVSRLANITPEQMYGLFLTETRIGQTPATAGRGLQYLLQSIAVPTSKGHAAALRQAGVTPEAVQQKGGLWAIRQIIKKMKTMGVTGDLNKASKISDETLDTLETADPAQQRSGLGISGRGIEFAQKTIGRIHGVRALIALLAQEEANKRMTRDQELIASAMADTEEAQQIYAKRWDDFARRQPLQAAAVSFDVMRRSVATAFEPGLNFGARQVTRVGEIVHDHPRAAHRTALAGGALIAALALSRGGGITGLFRRGGSMIPRAIAAGDIAAGAAQPRGFSPQKPLYVIVVGELFGPGRTTSPGPLGGIPGAGGKAGKPSFWKKVPFLPIAGVTATAALADVVALLATPGATESGAAEEKKKMIARDLKPYPRLRKILEKDQYTDIEKKAIDALFQGDKKHLFPKAAMEILKGEANVTMDINLKHPDGTVQRKKVHVPVDLWSGGKVPSSRGKHGKTNRAAPS